MMTTLNQFSEPLCSIIPVKDHSTSTSRYTLAPMHGGERPKASSMEGGEGDNILQGNHVFGFSPSVANTSGDTTPVMPEEAQQVFGSNKAITKKPTPVAQQVFGSTRDATSFMPNEAPPVYGLVDATTFLEPTQAIQIQVSDNQNLLHNQNCSQKTLMFLGP